ncbi:hypothetical protein BH11PSE11_BH11PSE11_19840 [soil metagenome]
MNSDMAIGGKYTHFRQRVRAMRRAAAHWAVIGGMAGTIWTLLLTLSMLEYASPIAWLSRGFFSSFIPVLILAFAVILSAESGAALAQRPMRLLLAVAIGATLSLGPMWLVDDLSGFRAPFALPRRMLYWWLNVMLLGSTFGWAAVLSLRHREDQDRLTTLLSRRALLARQVAQSRLMAARAQVDPAMIARILNDVRHRYRSRADEAGALLDHLIAYLRLAMNRLREQQPSYASEMAMVRAYLALRQAETNLQIDLQPAADELQAGQSTSTSCPLFVLVRCLVDEACLAGATSMALRIEPSDRHIVVTLEIGEASIPAQGIERLHAALREWSIDDAELAILHHSLDSGVNRYVATASIDASASDRSDRRG